MMLNIDEILEMWKKDSIIDDLNLDEASKKSAQLHSKYLELFSIIKLQTKKREQEQAVLLKDKWLWFNGKMEKSEMDVRGWPYDPFGGLKIMKGDMNYYFNADLDLQKTEERITYLKVLSEALSDILDSVKWRHQTIKNMLEWKKFTSGI